MCLTATRCWNPDVRFIRSEHLDLVTENHVSGSPDLQVAVRSASTRRIDLRRKLPMYRPHRVDEYSVADPQGKGTVQVFCCDGQAFVSRKLLSFGDALTYLGIRSALSDILTKLPVGSR